MSMSAPQDPTATDDDAGREAVENVTAVLETNISNEDSTLTLKGLNLDVVPDKLLTRNYKHLAALDLRRNALALLPSELFLSLTMLRELDVSENRLSYVPETIGLMSGLRKLRLQINKLRDLPDGICRLRSLEELDLSKNCLELLPRGIGILQNLRRLDLSGNSRLQEIPDEASQLVKLEHVDLNGSPIVRMPLTIQRLQTKGKLLRSKARRRKLVGRAMHIRASVRRAFAEEEVLFNL